MERSSTCIDVTGGMLGKVRTLIALIGEQPDLTVRIITGRRSRLVLEALLNPELQEGTLLHY
jgi:isopentenyl phosphate kinase